MAVRLKDKPKTTSGVLLDRLRKGQEELHRSFRVLNHTASGRGCEERSERRRRRELAVHRGGRKGGRGPLERVDNLPRKRARLMQLSPATSVGAMDGPSALHDTASRASAMLWALLLGSWIAE